MSTPIFPALNKIFPNSTIDALAIPASAILLKHNPYINKVFTLDKKSGSWKKIQSFVTLSANLRKENYDLCISIQNSMTSSMLMLLAGIKFRIGNRTQKFVTHNVIFPKGLHNRDRVLELLKPLSNYKFDNQTAIFLSDIEISTAENDIIKNKSKSLIKIGIAPGSVRATKKWSAEYFSKLAELLNNDKIHLYYFGSPDEKELCNNIINNSHNPNSFNYAGKINLLESSAMIQKMDLMITNDSAPLHIANAVMTDVFVFFGPTVKAFGCYPYRENDRIIELDLECRPCGKHGANQCPLGHHNCMKLITPEYVYKEIKDYFTSKKEHGIIHR